ncbi:MAG: hypothetical protein U9R36_01120, partial [Elusimicrobiota bacterium]|nr:hypothetical protein [Elusimicrobiota bacterium]
MTKNILRKTSIIKFLSLLLLAGISAQAYALSGTPETIIRVGILSGEKTVHIKSYGKLEAVDLRTLDKVKLKAGVNYPVEAS